jgi:superfamily II DNA or RNA helicase
MKNIGDEPLFSEFEVANPKTKRIYRVAIRGCGLGENYCSCPDFAVNTLGTCKHIEFALAKLNRKRGAKRALALGFQPSYSEIYLHYGARRDVVFKPGTECPGSLKTLAARYFSANGILQPDAFARFHHFLKKVRAADHEVRCYDDALAFIAVVRDQELLTERVERMLPSGIRSAAFRNLLKASLYPYQRKGALFAAKAGRCLIADDMGLGKTVQAIAATEILAQTTGIERVLVIAPTSLKHQWKREIDRFVNRQALVIEGLLARRQALYQSNAFYKITNYDVIYRDIDSIQRWEPNLIILDEAQRIKNWKTRTAQSVKQLSSDFAFVLTGTPLENRLEELYSIVEFVDRHRLGPMFRFLDQHQHVEETGRVIGYRNLGKIKKTLEPILIRRKKEEVLPELPERMEKRFFVPMTVQQWKHHNENREIVARIVRKWRDYGFLSETDQQRLMIALQNMRMSCNSTYLLDKKTDHGVKADETVELLSEILEDQDSKVVIFSQWVRMHELVVRRLKERRMDHVMFYGGVPGPQRKKLVDRFRQDPDCRLFLSTDAGGVGLNLQTASVVINLDQPWNPAVLEQRVGRVHRLGQHRPVRVVHFIAQGTIEEGMLELLGFKSAMFAGVLDGGKEEIFLGKTRLKRFMETVEKATKSIPKEMPTQTEQTGNGQKREASLTHEPRPKRAKPAEASGEQLWTDVISAGTRFLDNLTRALSKGQTSDSTTGDTVGQLSSLVARDESTGESYLKLPMPEPETMERVLDTVSVLMNSLRSK